MLENGPDKPDEKRMRVGHGTLVFRVVLHPDEPGVIRDLYHLHQIPVRRKAAENHPGGLKGLPVLVVELVSMPVPLTYFVRAIDCVNPGRMDEFRRIGPKAHGAAFVIVSLAGHGVIALHPFLEVVDDRFKPFLARLMVKFL